MCFGKRLVSLASVLCLTVLLGACSGSAPYYGYKSYDPCIACGDSITFYPNEEGGAQRFPRDWLGWEWGDGNPNLCTEYPNHDRCQ